MWWGTGGVLVISEPCFVQNRLMVQVSVCPPCGGVLVISEPYFDVEAAEEVEYRIGSWFKFLCATPVVGYR